MSNRLEEMRERHEFYEKDVNKPYEPYARKIVHKDRGELLQMVDELQAQVGHLPCYYKWNGGEDDCKAEGIQEWDFCPICLMRQKTLEQNHE